MLPTKFRFIWLSSFREEHFQKSTNLWWPCLLTNCDEMSNLYRGPSKDASYQISVHLGKRFQRRRFFKKSTNQKQEWSVVAMFVNGSERNKQSLQRTFQGCFLLSFDSFSQAVSEKKIFLEIDQLETRISCDSHVCNPIGTKLPILIEDLPQMLPNKFRFIWASGFL